MAGAQRSTSLLTPTDGEKESVSCTVVDRRKKPTTTTTTKLTSAKRRIYSFGLEKHS